ncbi:hypothetical protein ASZ90_009771 [hydrocarbon metagenome]|uniref:Uncharacterized protein n=1 Tax=hydrocarbon metagenome TaxID=938273 RepID=A0A0W8FHY9_9ZZZZ
MPDRDLHGVIAGAPEHQMEVLRAAGKTDRTSRGGRLGPGHEEPPGNPGMFT